MMLNLSHLRIVQGFGCFPPFPDYIARHFDEADVVQQRGNVEDMALLLRQVQRVRHRPAKLLDALGMVAQHRPVGIKRFQAKLHGLIEVPVQGGVRFSSS